MSGRVWIASLAALVALRVAIPLVALAASGHDLPGLPLYTYVPLNGDATGFYAEARELISTAFGPAGAAAALLLGAGAWSAWRLRPAWKALVAAAFAVSLAATVLVLGSAATGAAVVGWPLLWAIPLFPLAFARRARRGSRLRRRPSDPPRRQRGDSRRDRGDRLPRERPALDRRHRRGAVRALAAAGAPPGGRRAPGRTASGTWTSAFISTPSRSRQRS